MSDPQAQQQTVDALKAMGVPDADVQRAGLFGGKLKELLGELIPILSKWLLDKFLSGELDVPGQTPPK